jgi:hypothetical protein
MTLVKYIKNPLWVRKDKYEIAFKTSYKMPLKLI